MYHTKNCTNKNNVTRISMATKYPIIKDMPISGGGVSGLGKWKLGGKIMWKVEIRG